MCVGDNCYGGKVGYGLKSSEVLFYIEGLKKVSLRDATGAEMGEESGNEPCNFLGEECCRQREPQ